MVEETLTLRIRDTAGWDVQPVVVKQPVGRPGRVFTQYNRSSNRSYNRLYRVNRLFTTRIIIEIPGTQLGGEIAALK